MERQVIVHWWATAVTGNPWAYRPRFRDPVWDWMLAFTTELSYCPVWRWGVLVNVNSGHLSECTK